MAEILQNPIAKVLRGRICKTDLQAEILQIFQGGGIYKPPVQDEILQTSQEA